MPTTRTRGASPPRRALAVPLLLAALAATACTEPSEPGIPRAGGGSGASASPAGDPVAYAGCMRQHGVNMPDPDPDTPWPPRELRDAPGWDAADQACRHLLPAELGPPARTPGPAELEQLRGFAVCMREHDIEMSDPLPDGNIRLQGRLGNANKEQLGQDPGFQAALTACRAKLPSGWLGTEK